MSTLKHLAGEMLAKLDGGDLAAEAYRKGVIAEEEEAGRQRAIDKANDSRQRAIAAHEVTLPPLATVPLPKKQRSDAIDGVLRKAIKEVGNLDTSSIFTTMRNYAMEEIPPFSGAIDGADLVYTDNKNKSVKLTRNAVDKRLKRYRDDPSKSPITAS